MDQSKLRREHHLQLIALAFGIASTAAACQADSGALGFTLQYRCTGNNLVVTREEFENQRITLGPGYLGCNNAGVPENSSAFTWKQVSYLPDDQLGKMPTWVELQWTNFTPDFERWSAAAEKKQSMYKDYLRALLSTRVGARHSRAKANASTSHHSSRPI